MRQADGGAGHRQDLQVDVGQSENSDRRGPVTGMSKGKKKNQRQRSGEGAPPKKPLAPYPPPSSPRPPTGKDAMTKAAPVLEHRFNDDLLISEHDQQLAQDEYHEIYHVLDHPALRDEFLRYDAVANSAKLWVQRIGLLAVLLATTALLSSALTPLVGLLPRHESGSQFGNGRISDGRMEEVTDDMFGQVKQLSHEALHP